MRNVSSAQYTYQDRSHIRGIELQIALPTSGSWGRGWFCEVAESILEGKAKEIDACLLLAVRPTADSWDRIASFWFEEGGEISPL